MYRLLLVMCLSAGLILALGGCTETGKTGSKLRNQEKDGGVVEKSSFGYAMDYDVKLPGVGATSTDDVIQVTFTTEGGDFDVDVNPVNSNMIAFCSTRFSKNPQIFIANLGEGSVVQKTFDPAHSYIQPKFSPDGNRLAFASNCSGLSWDIFEINTFGKSAMTSVTGELRDTDEFHPTYAPDGFNKIGFSVIAANRNRIGIKDRLTGELLYLSTEGLYPEWSPKGDKIVFQQARHIGDPIYHIGCVDVEMTPARNADGGVRSLKRVANGKSEDCTIYNLRTGDEKTLVESGDWAAINPAWSPDGKYLAFATVKKSDAAIKENRRFAGDDIWVKDLADGSISTVTTDTACDWNPTWSKDGKIYFSSNRKGPKNIFAVFPKFLVDKPEMAVTPEPKSVPVAGPQDGK